MEEFVEILKENGKSTEKNISKKEAHKYGVCHGISAIGLIDKKGRLLIQKRAETKKDEPNKWDLSSAGHIDAGETAIDAAIREMYEELGVKVDENELLLIDTYLNKVKLNEDIYINHFTYLYIVKKDIKLKDIIIQEKEVSEIKFVNKKDFLEISNNGMMVEGIKHCGKILDYVI